MSRLAAFGVEQEGWRRDFILYFNVYSKERLTARQRAKKLTGEKYLRATNRNYTVVAQEVIDLIYLRL